MQIRQKKILKVVGIGRKKLKSVYFRLGLNFKKKRLKLKKKHFLGINQKVKKFSYLNTLRLKIKKVISFYKELRTYQGTRHLYFYPVKGKQTQKKEKTKKPKKKKKKNISFLFFSFFIFFFF